MNEDKFKEIIKKIEDIKREHKFDLSMEEDLTVGIMNLLSIEEHLFFTTVKTENEDYLDLLKEVREVRKESMKKILGTHEGETWCVSKHFLAATMRLIEVGTKYLAEDKKKEAGEIFKKAYRIYSLFWALRLKLIGVKDLDKDTHLKEKNSPWRFEDIVTKLVDCCKE